MVTKEYIDGLNLKRGETVAIREEHDDGFWFGRYVSHTGDHIHVDYSTIPPEIRQSVSYTHRLSEVAELNVLCWDVTRMNWASGGF